MRMVLDDYIDLKVIFLSAHEKTDKQQLPRNLNISLELHIVCIFEISFSCTKSTSNSIPT